MSKGQALYWLSIAVLAFAPYGLKFGTDVPRGNVTILDTGVVYSVTDQGNVCNFGEVFTTDGRILALDQRRLALDEQQGGALEPRDRLADRPGERAGGDRGLDLGWRPVP